MTIAPQAQPAVAQPQSYWPGTQDISEGAPAAYKRSKLPKKELLKRYRMRIDNSKRWRDDECFDDTWRRMIDLYRNKHFAEGFTGDKIAVNVAFSTVNTIVPSVSVNFPRISVNARNEPEQPAAEAGEAAVNYWWRHYDWRREVQATVKDSLVTGNGWVKVGWRYQTTARALTDAEQQAHIEEAQENASNAAEQDPAAAPQIPTDQQIAEQPPTETWEVCVDDPFVERVSPFDIFIDPEATCEADLKWIAQRIVCPIEDVRGDARYNRAARLAVQADASTNVRWRDNETDDEQGSKKYSDDVQRCTLWEFYDIRHGYYCVFAQSGDGFLLEPTDFPYPYGHPFVPLGNYSVPDQFYCLGDLEAIEPMQHELNAVRSDMMNHRKRWNRAFLINRQHLTPDAQRALLSDVDNRLIPFEDDVDLERVIQPLQQVPLDPQMYNYSTTIENDIDLVSGVSEYQRGAQSEIRRTATEAAMIQDASNARAADKLSQIEVFMAEIARRVLQLAQMYLTGDPRSARIVGPDGEQAWAQFDRDSIQGEFDFEVEAGSTQPRDATFRQQQALQLANVLSPYVADGTVNPAALVTYVLREGFGVKDVSQFIQQQPQEQGPSERLIESINYKDTPPDIQRQIEAQAGLQPSTMGTAMALQQQANEQQKAQGVGAQDSEGSSDQQSEPQGEPQQEGGQIPDAQLAQLAGQVGLSLPDMQQGQ